MARRSPTPAARRRTSRRSRTSATSTPRRSPAPRRSSAAPGCSRLRRSPPTAGLRGDTLVRLTPHDGVGARAIAAWLAERGVDDVLVVHDYGDEYGEPVGAMCAQAARERGLAVRIRPVWDHDEDPVADLGGRGPSSTSEWPARAPSGCGTPCTRRRRICGSSAATAWRRSGSPARCRRPRRGARASSSPRACRWASTATRRWRSPWTPSPPVRAIGPPPPAPRAPPAIATRSSGATPLDAEGHTTSTAYGRLAVVDGALVWDVQPAS